MKQEGLNLPSNLKQLKNLPNIWHTVFRIGELVNQTVTPETEETKIWGLQLPQIKDWREFSSHNIGSLEKPQLRLIILLNRGNSYIPAEGRQAESWAEY